MALNNFYFIQLCSRIYGLGDIEQTNELKKSKKNKNKKNNSSNWPQTKNNIVIIYNSS